MPRITKASLQEENAQIIERNLKLHNQVSELKGEIERMRARSRSPRRNAAPLSLTHAALGMVSRDFLRDPVIEEQRALIARQQQEIQRLREGEGSIGEVLLATRRRVLPDLVDDFFVEKCQGSTVTVANVIEKLERLTSTAHEILIWGHSFWEGRLNGRPFTGNSS